MNVPKIKKSISNIKNVPTIYFYGSMDIKIDSISKYVNFMIKYNNVTANSLADFIGISAAQMNKLSSGKLDNPSAIQAAKFCNDFEINLAILKFLLPNNSDSFFYDVETKLKNNIKFNYTNEKHKGTLTEKQFIYVINSIKRHIVVRERILNENLKLTQSLELNDSVIDHKLTYVYNDKIYNIGLIFLPDRNRKTRPNYWDDDLRDFTNGIINIISDDDILKNINDLFFVTSSVYVYNKITKKFKDISKKFDKNLKLIYIDTITDKCLYLDIFSTKPNKRI